MATTIKKIAAVYSCILFKMVVDKVTVVSANLLDVIVHDFS